MTYNVFGGTLSLTQSINQAPKRQSMKCNQRRYYTTNNYVYGCRVNILSETNLSFENGISKQMTSNDILLLLLYESNLLCYFVTFLKL